LDRHGGGSSHDRRSVPFAETPAGCLLQWIFVHDWNRCILICGKDASLSWLEPVPVPSRALTRALFPGETVPDAAV